MPKAARAAIITTADNEDEDEDEDESQSLSHIVES